MTKFDKIMEIVKGFQQKADKIFTEYTEKERIAKGRLSEAGFRTEFMLDAYPRYASQVQSEANIAKREVNEIFVQIEKEFKEWTLKPVDSAILQTLDYIRNFSLRLTMQELQIIEQGISGSYFGTKIFAAIAKDNGFQVNVANVDDFMNSLKLAKSAVKMAIVAYAGSGENGFPGRDLIKHNIINNIDYGEFPVWRLAIASEFCTKTNSDLIDAEQLWLETKAPAKYVLTQDEQRRIRSEIDKIVDAFEVIDKEKADKLLENTPDILSRLDSMPDDYKYKELAQHYYMLGLTGSEKDENKSMINPAVQQAAEYTKSQNSKVNEDILKHYI